MLTKAILRIPGSNFAEGLTTVDLGTPHFDQVLAQHAHYSDALRACGLSLTVLDPDLRYPDSTFVEDTAILTPRAAILTRPGAATRKGEVDAILPVIQASFETILRIEAPGTVDGGDICEAENHFFIGISHRTNPEGARQLAAHLSGLGYTSSAIDIRAMTTILHLKSGIAHIGENTLVVMDEMADDSRFQSFNSIRVSAEESYAANCVRVNDRVLLASGYPRLQRDLIARSFTPLLLDMSEFRKMDGGLSCLSLRF